MVTKDQREWQWPMVDHRMRQDLAQESAARHQAIHSAAQQLLPTRTKRLVTDRTNTTHRRVGPRTNLAHKSYDGKILQVQKPGAHAPADPSALSPQRTGARTTH